MNIYKRSYVICVVLLASDGSGWHTGFGWVYEGISEEERMRLASVIFEREVSISVSSLRHTSLV